MLAAAWYLSRLSTRERPGVPLMSVLFAGSGLVTAVSGVLAVLLAGLASDVVRLGTRSRANQLVEVLADLRWITGKVGFTLAGLALIVVLRDGRRVGGPLRNMAPLSVVIGVAMQFIWIDSSTVVHRVIGAAFLVWLVASGGMLLAGRGEGLVAPLVHRSS